MSDGCYDSSYLGECPECKEVMLEGHHVSWYIDSDGINKKYHSSCLIQKLKGTIARMITPPPVNMFKRTRHLTYLASPYTHDNMNVKIQRYETAVTAAYLLTQKDELVFTPIGLCHPIALRGNLPGDWKYWNEFDTRMILACDSVTVLMIDGWRESEGVQAEIKLARKLNKQLRCMDSEDWKVRELIA